MRSSIRRLLRSFMARSPLKRVIGLISCQDSADEANPDQSEAVRMRSAHEIARNKTNDKDKALAHLNEFSNKTGIKAYRW